MSRGKRVPKEVRAYISTMAYLRPHWETWELTQDATAHFKGRGLFLPGPDSFRKIAKEAREETSEDAPWSIGGASSAFIPPEALGDVLAVWSWTKLGSVGFTIRQAKWVACLRLLLQGKDHRPLSFEENLYEWATRYAIREKATEVREPPLPLDTTDLDARLAFPREVYLALVDTGAVLKLPYEHDLDLLSDVGPEFSLRPSWFDLHGALEDEDFDALVWLRFSESLDDLRDSIADKDHSDAMWEVGSIWLKVMSAASGWRQLSVQRRKDVILEVYGNAISLEKDGTDFRPSDDLLVEVGYED